MSSTVAVEAILILVEETHFSCYLRVSLSLTAKTKYTYSRKIRALEPLFLLPREWCCEAEQPNLSLTAENCMQQLVFLEIFCSLNPPREVSFFKNSK